MTNDKGAKKDPEEVKTKPEGKQELTPAKPEEVKTEPKATPGELPESVSARTQKQFDKLTQSNQRLLKANQILQEELTKKARSEQTFAPIQQVPGAPVQEQQTLPPPATPPTATPPQKISPPEVERFIETDPVTGEQYVNEVKLREAITDANARAVRAETTVRNYVLQQQATEEERQTREAYKAHPELKPDTEKFDKELHKRTRSLLLDSMMNPSDYEEHALTFKEAADLAKSQSTKQAKKVEKKVGEQRQEALEKKEQASLAAQGQTGVQPPQKEVSEELRGLIDRTRTGDPWALAQRLQHTPHTGTPTSSEEGKEAGEGK